MQYKTKQKKNNKETRDETLNLISIIGQGHGSAKSWNLSQNFLSVWVVENENKSLIGPKYVVSFLSLPVGKKIIKNIRWINL